MNQSDITHLVFDLGGVIVELNGQPLKNEWLSVLSTPEEIWHIWLTSDAPRQFESGKLTEEEFASRLIAELKLPIDKEAFLRHFLTLPDRVFPGARELLTSLNESYETSLLSNSNATHWAKKMNELNVGPMFKHHFASHLMGHVKPDEDAYRYVLARLKVEPERILFFDDNQLNVDAARRVGMNAEKTAGPDAVIACLQQYHLKF